MYPVNIKNDFKKSKYKISLNKKIIKIKLILFLILNLNSN